MTPPPSWCIHGRIRDSLVSGERRVRVSYMFFRRRRRRTQNIMLSCKMRTYLSVWWMCRYIKALPICNIAARAVSAAAWRASNQRRYVQFFIVLLLLDIAFFQRLFSFFSSAFFLN